MLCLPLIVFSQVPSDSNRVDLFETVCIDSNAVNQFPFINFDKNKLEKLTGQNILKLIKGNILEKKYRKNSVNIFFIKKKLEN